MLQLYIYSFSFHKTDRRNLALPHGGGFEFDCRCLPNPGRKARYKERTGLDEDVIGILVNSEKVSLFLDRSIGLVRTTCENYLERGFDSVNVGFGCTGGQHRSVYCASQCASILGEDDRISIKIEHLEFPNFDWLK